MGTYIIYNIETGENAGLSVKDVPMFFVSREEAQQCIKKLDLPFWKYSIALSFEVINPNYGMEI